MDLNTGLVDTLKNAINLLFGDIEIVLRTHNQLKAHGLGRSSQRIDSSLSAAAVGEVGTDYQTAVIKLLQSLQKLLRRKICYLLIKGNVHQHIHAKLLQKLLLLRTCYQRRRHHARTNPFKGMVAEGKYRQLRITFMRFLPCGFNYIKMTAMQTVKGTQCYHTGSGKFMQLF